MKMTLLEIVQDVLSSLGSFEVNSIGDTAESYDIARIVRRKYLEIVSLSDLGSKKQPVEVEGFADPTRPTLLRVPESVQLIHSLSYDCQTLEDPVPNYKELTPLELEDFLKYTNGRRGWDDTVTLTYTSNGNSIPFVIRTDIAPTYYTTIDDTVLVLDAYDSTVDTSLHKNKTICIAEVAPSFVLADSTVAELKKEQFILLLNESISIAWNEVKLTQNAAADRSARRGWVHLQKVRETVPPRSSAYSKLPNYGRKC